jgi:hypothetical protein
VFSILTKVNELVPGNQLFNTFVFIPSVLGENIPTAEFGKMTAETARWDIKKKMAKFLMRTFTYRSTFLYNGLY